MSEKMTAKSVGLDSAGPANTHPVHTPAAAKTTPAVNYTSHWVRQNQPYFDKAQMQASLRLACQWLIECSMCPSEQIPDEENPHGYQYQNWLGAAREYNALKQSWHVFGPLWHTGQTVKALALAYGILGDENLLKAAIHAADFIMRARLDDPQDPDFGAIYAQENASLLSATSCMLESLDGLIILSEISDQPHYLQAALDCIDWAGRRLFLPDQGLFFDDFDFQDRQARSAPNTLLHQVPGRPLIEDGVFLKAFQKTGNKAFKDVFFAVAQRLLADEFPPGNWIKFPPCDQVGKLIHPRQAYWWARPMVMAWQESHDEKYLHCAQRAGQWYLQAQRIDGGMFRLTDLDFKTTSYGQATSGILSAACLWHNLIVAGQGEQFRDALKMALSFGHAMQFTKVADPNLKGAILEKVLKPDGTDRLPYYVRDLGTIFYVQALALALKDNLL